jgi:uncharacterized membrane protein
MKQRQIISTLGWFSIGLGLVEILAPRRLGKSIGVGERSLLLPVMGVREIASGVGILSRTRPAPWAWSRVAGDLIDLALLSTAIRSDNPRRAGVAAAAATVAGVTVLDLLCSKKLSERDGARYRREARGHGFEEFEEDEDTPGVVELKRSIIVNRSPEEVYRFWRDLDNLPKFMGHVKSIQMMGENRSHWEVKGPAGTTVAWDSEITEDIPNEKISWRSLPGADVDNSGTVRFEKAPGGRGTWVRVELAYDPPGGRIGSTVAKLFGQAPEKQIKMDLLRLRQLLETGEIARTEGQAAGRSRSTSRKYDDFVRS